MARVLKIKLVIGVVSIIMIVILRYVNSAGFVDVVHKRWGSLTWDDFDGFVPAFTQYRAGVASYISFEYDSSRERFVAYAFQVNISSWVKPDSIEQTDVLRHEQYHFNISEVFARRLNAYINETPNCTANILNWRLKAIEAERKQMQDAYDVDTRHSILMDKQRRWEFKIDSLLLLENGWVVDPYSRIRTYFATSPDSSIGVSGNATFRRYSSSKHNVYLSMMTISNDALTPEQVQLIGRDAVQRFGATLTTDSVGNVRAEAVYDSVFHRTRMIFVSAIPNVYLIHARYPVHSDDTTGYAQIATSFMNSLRLPEGHFSGRRVEVP